MTDKAVEARREYRRQWRKNNPEKVKAATDRYWEKKARLAEQANRSEAPRVVEQ